MEVLRTLYECIVLNCDAHMQMRGVTYKPAGSPVEVGLLNFLLSNGVNVQEKLIERESDAVALKLWIPFSSERKLMTVAYTLRDDPSTTRLVVKGAPEHVVAMCSTQLDSFNNPSSFAGDQQQGAEYLSQVVEEDIIKPRTQDDTGLKALTIAFRDFPTDQFDAMRE